MATDRRRFDETVPSAPQWSTDDFAKITNEELARLASTDVLENEAYFELWRRTNDFVSEMVLSRIKGQDAQHTVTTFFCHKLPRVLHRYNPTTKSGSFDAWLATVVRNYLNDLWRAGKIRRTRQVELDARRPDVAGRMLSVPAEVDRQCEQEHLVYFLREIMQQILSPEDLYIFRARYWEDRSLKEIAEEIGCSPESVRVRHWRAKKRLHKACMIYRETGLL